MVCFLQRVTRLSRASHRIVKICCRMFEGVCQGRGSFVGCSLLVVVAAKSTASSEEEHQAAAERPRSTVVVP